MSSSGLLGWLGRIRSRPAADSLVPLLRKRGVTDAVLQRAQQRRVLVGTRLASTLVVQGDLDEETAIAALSQHVGLPGLCLERSIVDLSCFSLPPEIAETQLLLPVRRHPSGVIVVACADPPDEGQLQHIELLLGHRVIPHVALHFYLKRAIRAVICLRHQRPDAAYLVGDGVELTSVAVPHNHVSTVLHPMPGPPVTTSLEAEANDGCRAVLAMPPSTTRERLAAKLSMQGVRVAEAEDGACALRLVAEQGPALLVTAALLPNCSGAEIMRWLAASGRYRSTVKILLVPDLDAAEPKGLDGIEELIVTGEEHLEQLVDENLTAVLRFASTDTVTARRRAQAAFFRARAALEEADVQTAAAGFREALGHDPLLPQAQIHLARLELQAGETYTACERFKLADALGGLGEQELAAWADAVQRRGDVVGAARLWRRAAELWPDPNAAELLREHAAALCASRGADTGPALEVDG